VTMRHTGATASKPRQLRPDDSVVRIEQRMPVTVADLRSPPRRVHDVGEQHRGENPIVGHLSLVPGEELGDFLERRPPRLNEVVHVAPRQLNVLRAREVISDVLAPLGQDEGVVGVLADQGRHANCRKNRPHVQLGQERHHESYDPGRRGVVPLPAPPPIQFGQLFLKNDP
jgi:hypothetical protein